MSDQIYVLSLSSYIGGLQFIHIYYIYISAYGGCWVIVGGGMKYLLGQTVSFINIADLKLVSALETMNYHEVETEVMERETIWCVNHI